MTRQQVIQLAIILLVLSMSAISWAIRQFREYQAKQGAKAAAQRRREQMLRTGRVDGAPAAPSMQPAMPPPPTTVHDDARRKLIELAQRRKAELEEMARRAAAGGGASRAGGSAAPPQRPAAPFPPAPTRTPQPRPVQRVPQPAQRPAPPRPQQRPNQPPVSASDARRNEDKENRLRREARERREITREKAEREQTDRDKVEARAESIRSNAEYTRDTGAPSIASSEITDAPSADQIRDPRRALAASLAGLRQGSGTPQATAEAWRRAIIMSEILGPSVAMRPPGDAGGSMQAL
jgi:hypothetical protein